ncbi:MAG: glycosyltransferase [Myxococcota bacterium]
MSARRYRVGVVARHPIQYQAGIWRALAAHPRIDANVIFLDTIGVDGTIDPTLNAAMAWDVPMLEGYPHEFVRNLSPARFTAVVDRINPGVGVAIRRGGYDAVILHGYLSISNWLALVASRRAGAKIVYRGEGSVRGRTLHDGRAATAIKHPLNRWFLDHCDAVAYSSTDNRDYQISRGAREEQLFAFPCAVDNDELARLRDAAETRAGFRERVGIPHEATLVLNVGRFTDHKCTGDCIAALAAPALARRPDVHLALAGDGPLRADLEALARSRRVADRVHFLGFLGQAQIASAMRAADLFVLPSNRDPSPKALSEALYFGLPAVCSDAIGTAPDLVLPGENGAIFPLNDVRTFAEAIADVAASPARLRSFGARSHEIALANDFAAGIRSLVAKLDTLFEGGSRDE